MTRELVVNVWCDVCEDREPGETTPPLLADGKTRTLDLCERHRKELVDPLLAALREHGAAAEERAALPTSAAPRRTRRPRAEVPPEGEIVCKVPGCVRRGVAGSSTVLAFKQHVRTRHDLTAQEYVATYGKPRTIAGAEVELWAPDPEPVVPGDPWVCGVDDCTKRYDPEEYAMPAQALGLHRRTAHGVDGSSRRSAQERRQRDREAS